MAKHTSVNQLPATGAAALYQLKTTLVAASWVVMSSSDGTTYNSSGDQITLATSLAATNAWFRIRDPGTRREFVFQRTTNNTLWRIKVSESGGFTGGTPGITRVPSATDEGVFYGSGTDASPTGAQLLPTDNTYRCHVIAFSDAVATNVYSFFLFTADTGTGTVKGKLYVDGTDYTSDGELSPMFILAKYDASGATLGTYLTGGALTAAWIYVLYGTSVQAFVNVPMYGIPSGGASCIPAGASSTQLAADPYTGEYGIWKAMHMSRSKSLSATAYEWRGVCSRMTWNPVYNVSYPNTFSLSLNSYVCTDPAIIVPWEDGTVPLA